MLAAFLSNCLPVRPAYVEAKILARVRDAYDHVPFYRALLDERGLAPADFASLADYVEKFPRTSAKDYRRAKKERGDLFVMDERFAGEPMVRALSSGSSGVPAVFLRTPQESAAIDGAKTVYAYVSAGVRPWHRIMTMKPPWDMKKRRHPLQALGLFRRFDASFVEDADVLLDRIAENGVNVMTGRASIMLKIAERALATGREVAPMAVMLPGGEMVSPQTRKLLVEVFRPRRYGELYGSTETGLIALRKGGGDYEVDYRSVFFALRDPRTENGISTGPIAVTSLHSAAAPILMLELGDVVSCRNYRRLLALGAWISAIEGRADEYAIDRKGKKIFAATFYSLFTQAPEVRQFRVVQEREGECDMFVLAEQGADLSGLEARISRHLDGRISPRFHYVDRIPFDDSGKVSIVINRLAQSSPRD
jgi:phenylacetate-coenzyme A ligase PaaK-like adenylate-forming protein